jgi:hypothetical protein
MHDGKHQIEHGSPAIAAIGISPIPLGSAFVVIEHSRQVAASGTRMSSSLKPNTYPCNPARAVASVEIITAPRKYSPLGFLLDFLHSCVRSPASKTFTVLRFYSLWSYLVGFLHSSHRRRG